MAQNESTLQEIELGSWFLARMCKSILQKKLQKRFLIFWEFSLWRPFLGEKLQFLWKNCDFSPKNGRHFGNSQNIKNRFCNFFCNILLHILAKNQLPSLISCGVDTFCAILQKNAFEVQILWSNPYISETLNRNILRTNKDFLIL